MPEGDFTPRSYYCTCDSGWTGEFCSEDDNECTKGFLIHIFVIIKSYLESICSPDEICINTVGSYVCESATTAAITGATTTTTTGTTTAGNTGTTTTGTTTGTTAGTTTTTITTGTTDATAADAIAADVDAATATTDAATATTDATDNDASDNDEWYSGDGTSCTDNDECTLETEKWNSNA